jgi:hypothetical protein
MKLRKTIFLALTLALLTCSLSLFSSIGKASAASRFTGKDEKRVKEYCKKALGDKASQIELGACYQGYVFGYDDSAPKSKCNDIYNGKPNAIQACRNQGYNGGVNNSAKVSSPPKTKADPNNGIAAGSADQCGNSPGIGVSIDIGCRGQGNPIADMTFAIIRVLSAGVGLVVVGSIVVGGIQYSASRGDPQATAMAINRIRSSLFALLIYIFGFAILNYIIPGAILQ